MTIDTGNSNSNVRHTKHADGAKSHGKGPTSPSETAAGADFMAILAGMGVTEDPLSVQRDVDADALLGVPAALPVADPSAVVVDATAAAAPLTLPLTKMDIPTAGARPADAPVATDGVIGPTQPQPAASPDALMQLLAGQARGVPEGVATEPTAISPGIQNAVVLPQGPTPVGVQPAHKGGELAQAEGLAALETPANGTPDLIKVAAPLKAAKGTKAMPMDDAALSGRDAWGAAAQARTGGESRAVQSSLLTQIASQATAAPALASALPELSGVLRESTRTRFSDKLQGGESWSPLVSPSPSPQGLTTTEVPVVQETFIAEKVAYWVSNDVQNAELKVDGLGEQPVEVSIRLHGNEAHVTFRTDELQARNALENAGSQLKDLLQQQGLNLAGVSVGTTGTGNGNGQRDAERKGRSQARVGSVEVAAEADVARPRAAGLSVGRSLDLFV